MQRGLRKHSRGRFLGISLLILSLFHVPLPQLDFHNVRHHDAPGELCEYHDHLLRWHAQAGDAKDVATLHWHWVYPSSDPLDLSGPGDGPALHAHIGNWDAPGFQPSQPELNQASSRTLDLDLNDQVPALFATLDLNLDHTIAQPRPNAVRAFCATFAPHASLPCLVQRWTC